MNNNRDLNVLDSLQPNQRICSSWRRTDSSTTAEIQQVTGGAVASGRSEGRGELPSFESHASSGQYRTGGDELNRFAHSSAPTRRWNNSNNHHQQSHHQQQYSNNNYGNRPAGRSSPRSFVPFENQRHNVEFQVRGILNKITPENFDKLCAELLDVGLQSTDVLKRVLLLIFNKALDDQKYSFMYARLCKLICESLSSNDGEISKETVFKKLLLSKCKEEFENRRIAFEEFENKREPLDEDEEEQRAIAKQKMLGNIRFICELGKQDLLPKNILHECIKQLLSKKKNQTYKDKVKDLECLCEIMKNIGYLLEAESEARPLLDQYFERMSAFSTNHDFSSRIRFMLLDVIDLRKNNWAPRQPEVRPSILERNEEIQCTDPVISNYIRKFKSNNSKQNDDVFSRNNLGPYFLGTGPGAITDDFSGGQGFNSKNQGYGSGRFGKNSPPNYQSGGSGGQGASGGGTGGGGGYNQRQRDYRNQNNQLFPMSSNSGYGNNPGSNNRDALPPRLQNKMNQNSSNNNHHNNNNNANNNSNNRHNNFQPFFLNNNENARTGVNKEGGPFFNDSPRMSPKLTPKYMLQPAVRSPLKSNGKESLLNDMANVKIADPVVDSAKKLNVYNECEKLLLKYYEDENVEEFVTNLKALNINFEDALFNLLRVSLSRKEEEREKTFMLITIAKKDHNLATGQHFQACLKGIFKKVGDLDCEFPRARSQFASFVGMLIVEKVCTLKEISELFEGGKYYPAFPLLLQSLKKTQGEDWLFEIFTESKIHLMSMLPEIDRNKVRMADLLEERKLTFLYPMLRIESEIAKQVTAPDCNSESLYKWLRENVNVSLQSSSEFISVVFCALMKHIIGSNTDDGSFNSANFKSQALEMNKFRDVLRKFLDHKPNLQLVVLYSLQAYCDELNFPKGLLEKWFNMLYELDIVDSPVFTTWKEDINDQFKGKGKALFQVNKWLIWLEDEEDEDEEEEEE